MAQRLVATRDPLGRETTYTYDANGQRTTVTSPLGSTTAFSYNARGQRVALTDPRGYTVTSYPNAFDEQRGLTNRRHQTYQFTYDGNGNLLSLWTPLGTATQRVWNDRDLMVAHSLGC